MKTIKEKAEEYAKTKHTNINLIEIVSWDFEAGANYVLDEIEKVIRSNSICEKAIFELGKLVIQLKK